MLFGVPSDVPTAAREHSQAATAPVTTVRSHTYDDAGNRLTTATDGVVDHTWTYDEGNLAATMDGLAYGFNPQGASALARIRPRLLVKSRPRARSA